MSSLRMIDQEIGLKWIIIKHLEASSGDEKKKKKTLKNLKPFPSLYGVNSAFLKHPNSEHINN